MYGAEDSVTVGLGSMHEQGGREMRWLQSFLVGFTSLALLPAYAAETAAPIAFNWDEPRQFYISADVNMSELLILQSSFNVEARASQFKVDLVTTCSKTQMLGKRVWVLDCKIDDIALSATAYKADKGRDRMIEVLDDMDQKLTGRSFEVEMLTSGKIRTVSLMLDEADLRNERMRRVRETMRMMLLRAVAALEHEVPSKPVPDGQPWTINESMAMGFLALTGTMGKAKVEAGVVARRDGRVVIDSIGSGIIGPATMIGTNGQERTANMYDMEMRSRTTFDVELGAMITRDYLVSGTVTASSVMAEYGGNVPYVQKVALRLIRDGEEPPTLGPNRSNDPSATPALTLPAAATGQ